MGGRSSRECSRDWHAVEQIRSHLSRAGCAAIDRYIAVRLCIVRFCVKFEHSVLMLRRASTKAYGNAHSAFQSEIGMTSELWVEDFPSVGVRDQVAGTLHRNAEKRQQHHCANKYVVHLAFGFCTAAILQSKHTRVECNLYILTATPLPCSTERPLTTSAMNTTCSLLKKTQLRAEQLVTSCKSLEKSAFVLPFCTTVSEGTYTSLLTRTDCSLDCTLYILIFSASYNLDPLF